MSGAAEAQMESLAEQATEALACFDTDRLEHLTAQAMALRVLLGDRPGVVEAPCRLRVFAAVLRGTEDNLKVVRRLRTVT